MTDTTKQKDLEVYTKIGEATGQTLYSCNKRTWYSTPEQARAVQTAFNKRRVSR